MATPSEWRPIFPVPESAPPPKLRHSRRGEPLRVFSYKDAEGRLLGVACRFADSAGAPLQQG
jgi:hypothetical protein